MLPSWYHILWFLYLLTFCHWYFFVMLILALNSTITLILSFCILLSNYTFHDIHPFLAPVHRLVQQKTFIESIISLIIPFIILNFLSLFQVFLCFLKSFPSIFYIFHCRLIWFLRCLTHSMKKIIKLLFLILTLLTLNLPLE